MICRFFSSVVCFLSIIVASNFIPNIAWSAPTDCVQMAADGTVNCIKAKSNWWGSGKSFETFKELSDYYSARACSGFPSTYTCRPKDFVGLWNARSCSSQIGCDVINEPWADNTKGYLYYAYYVTGSSGNGYSIGGSIATHSFSCPTNYSTVYPNNDMFSALCKPSAAFSSVDLSSPNISCDSCGSKSPSFSQYLSGASVAGDPVSINSGNQYIVENDYFYHSSSPLIFTRTYNSKNNQWTHNWQYSLVYTETNLEKTIVITLPNGSAWSYRYNADTNNWDNLNLVDSSKLMSDGDDFIYILENKNKILFSFVTSSDPGSKSWKTTKITSAKNNQYNLTYDLNGFLNKVINSYGNELIINQVERISSCISNSDGPHITFVGNNNNKVQYIYDSNCRLSKVIYADNTFKTYSYNGRDIYQITNELNNVMQTNNFGQVTGRGKVITQTGLGTNGLTNASPIIEKITFGYNTNFTTVKDALNNNVTVYINNQNNQNKPVSYSSLCTWCDGIQGSNIAYNTNGYIKSVTDFKSNITLLDYDSNKNLLTQIKESVNNSALERQTDITYDAVWNLPTTITEPSGVLVNGSYNNRITNNTYDQATGLLIQKSITAPDNNSTTRTWNYLYDSQNRLQEVQNPKYNANLGNDRVVYSYNTTGQIETVTNGLNHVTRFNSYDNLGLPTSITSPDGNNITVEYNLRGKPISTTKNGANTSFVRNAAQLITRMNMPSGSYKILNYDNVQRLANIEEYNENNIYQGKVIYTLNSMSNLTSLQVLDSNGATIRLNTKQYNNKNMLFKDLTALNYATTYTYDTNGNLQNILDANNGNTAYTYDSLNRISTQTSSDSGITTYSYNPDDSIANVIAPTNQTTSYEYNGFGEIIKIISPDTGITTMNRNSIGEIITKTDSRGIVSNYTYDDIGRPLTVNYSDSNENITISYDNCSVGKTCTVNDVSGSTSYTYNTQGNVESRSINNFLGTKTINYSYDNFNRLNGITYPSGMIINYTYSNEKPIAITYNSGSSSGNIISNGVYEPFSSNIKSFQYGNGEIYTKNFNKDGQIASISTSNSVLNVNQIFGFDSRLNINSIAGNNAVQLGYDNKSRITSYNGISYNYNQNDNRTTAGGSTYNYLAGSNKLNNISGSLNDNLGYDNSGNQISSNGKIYTYNNAGSFIGYNDGFNNFTYTVNSLGERLAKIDNINQINSTSFVYDGGMILGEYKNNSSQEYVYLNGDVIAMIKNGIVYNVYNDHLGTPRTVTDQNNNIVWKWDNTEAFGNNLPTIQTVEFNLRFPGQYFDNESNLHYNYYRTYNPKTGKYIQSDPLGLEAGTNTYGYVSGNSLGAVDPLGLDVWVEGSSGGEPLPHKSISIGNPNGKYVSISFAINSMGKVYQDRELGGEILKILRSNPEEDKIIINYLVQLAHNSDNKKIYGWDYTCMGYSEEKFEQIKLKFNLKQLQFIPQRSVQRNWNLPLMGQAASSSSKYN